MSTRAVAILLVFNQAQEDGSAVFTNSMDFPALIIAIPRPSLLSHCRCSFDPYGNFSRLLSRRRRGLIDQISKKKEPKHGVPIAGSCLREPFTSLRSGAVLGDPSRMKSRSRPSKLASVLIPTPITKS